MNIDIDAIQADIEVVQHRVRALQNETIHTITIKPTGKIEVVDKERLEALNSEVDRLNVLAGHNSDVVQRLRVVLQKVNLPNVAALMHAKKQSETRITDSKIGINHIIGTFLKDGPNWTTENIREHPRVKPEVESREVRILREEANLKRFIPTLAEAQAVLQDFQPSGLQPIKQAREVTPLIGHIKEQLAAGEIGPATAL